MRVLLIIAAAFALLVSAVYLLRDPIATAAFGAATDTDKVRCSHAEVKVARMLDMIEIAPLECELTGSPLVTVRTHTPTRIWLQGSGVKRVEVSRMTMGYRQRDVSHVEFNELASVTGLPEKLMRGLLDASELYSSKTPDVRIEQLTVLRGGKKENVMHGYTLRLDGKWNRGHAERVETGIEGVVEVREFDMRVTPARGKLSMGIHLGEAGRQARVGVAAGGPRLGLAGAAGRVVSRRRWSRCGRRRSQRGA
jgi:hypothetical protein